MFMKVSFFISSKRPIEETLEIVKFIDSINYYSVYSMDHLMPWTLNSIPDPFIKNDTKKYENFLECWTTITYLSAVTKNIKIGTLVSPVGIRDPRLIARMAGTLHYLSNERFILGLGTGWNKLEHISYGYNLLSPKDRIDYFIESISIIDGLLNNNKFSFIGNNFIIKNAECHPNGQINKIPILIGCNGKKMIDVANKFADIINIQGINYDKLSLISNLKTNKKISVTFTFSYLNNILNEIIKYRNAGVDEIIILDDDIDTMYKLKDGLSYFYDKISSI